MTSVLCYVPGCKSVFETSEQVAEKVTFICGQHIIDEKNKDIRFQDHQFDKDLDNSALPDGTSHIEHQGSRRKSDYESGLKKPEINGEGTSE